MVGRKPKVEHWEIIALIKKNMHHFKTNHFPPYGSTVWKEMEKDLGARWTHHSVYTHVTENKKKSLSIARQDCGIMTPPPMKKNEEIEEPSIINDDSNYVVSNDSPFEEEDFPNHEDFHLFLSSLEWQMIKPNETTGPVITRLKPRIWANVITNAFWLRYNMPCAFIAKWSKVKIELDGSWLIKFGGKCKSKACGNVILGTADKLRTDGALDLAIRTCDTRGKLHEEVKRPLNGLERVQAGDDMENRKPDGYRRELARKYMQFGQDEPPIIRSAAVYCQTKMEHQKRKYGIEKTDKRDQATIVRDMSGEAKYSQTIIDVGANPFHVIFCSPEQVLVYKEYCRVVSQPRTATDASGKFVRKLEKCPGVMTGHIFLYTVTINFEKKTIPIYQMLTERQDADWIIYWLRTWLRKFKVKPPKESTSDEERALVLGQCQAFNGMTIKKYIDEVFLWARDETRRKTQPFPATTVIRLDVAHFVSAAAKWSCLNDSYKFRTKRFYVRVITLMIDCQSVAEFRHIFLLTCIVALIPVNDYVVKTTEFEMTALEARHELENHISIRGPIIDKMESFSENNESDIPYNFDPLPEESSPEGAFTVTHQWIKDLISLVKSENPEQIPGDVENAFYLPPFIDDLERVGKEFPLWTGAAIPNGERHASSAYQEGYFNAVRNGVFQNVTLPCVCHVFLKKLLDDILSGNIYMSKELKKFVHNKPGIASTDRPDSSEAEKNQPKGSSRNSQEKETENVNASSVSEDIPENGANVSQEKIFQENDRSNIERDQSKENTDSCIGKDTAKINQHSDGPGEMDSDFLSEMRWRGIINDKEKPFWQEISTDDFSEKNPNTADIISDLLNLESANLDDHVLTEEMLNNFVDIDNNNNSFTEENPSWTHPKFDDKSSSKVFTSSPLQDHSYANLLETEVSVPAEVPAVVKPQTLRTKSKEWTADVQSKKKQGKMSKSKKREGYFAPYPQIRILNERGGCKQTKEFFLPNGLRCPYVKFSGMRIKVEQSCGFDSIVHILQSAAMDDPTYKLRMKSSKNELLQFIAEFMQSGPTTLVLHRRCSLLAQFYAVKVQDNATSLSPVRMNVKDAICSIWSKFSMEPNGTRRGQCRNQSCLAQQSSIVNFLPVDPQTIVEHGFKALASAITLHRSWKCRRLYCGGTIDEITLLNDTLLIELDVRPDFRQKHGLECNLRDVPLELYLGKMYRLIGVIHYRKSDDHFIAYCRRMTGRWVECNDMNLTSVSLKNDDIQILPVGAIYIA